MDIGLLAEQRQRRIDELDSRITQAQAAKAAEEEVRDRLHELSSQSTYSIADINFLIDVSNMY